MPFDGTAPITVFDATKEPTVTAGVISQYWRGDKSWQTLNTAVVPESTNLHYTAARASAAAPVQSVAGRAGTVVLAESDVANLVTDLAAKALDSLVVHLAGAETVTGAKSFSANTMVGSSGSALKALHAVLPDGDYVIVSSSLNAQGAQTGVRFRYASGVATATIASIEAQLVATSKPTLFLKTATNGTNTLVERARVTQTGLGVGTLADPTSTLHSGGSLALPTTTVTTATTLDATMYTLRSNSTSALTHILPTAVGITGRIYVVKSINTGAVTVATTSSQTIDGANTYSLPTQYKQVTVQSNGTSWDVIGNN